MKNILSWQHGEFTGKEIKEWIAYHMEHHTGHYAMAKQLCGYANTIYDDRMYTVVLRRDSTACGEVLRYKPLLLRCDRQLYYENEFGGTYAEQ